MKTNSILLISWFLSDPRRLQVLMTVIILTFILLSVLAPTVIVRADGIAPGGGGH